MTESYKCATCGEVHEGLPMSFAADFPDKYASLNRDERDSRAVIGSEYPETLNLKTKILVQSVGTCPLFVIEETDHLLAIEQASGISRAGALELASLALHSRPGGFSKSR